jgi:eukaryotic-like serine/threonine-protein kinase
LHWVDRQGREESLNVEPRGYTWPRISPDGTRVALEVDQSGNRDVWIYDLVRKRFQQLTVDPAEDTRPAWTPDSQRVAFSSTRDRGEGNLYWQRVDGAGQAERLTSEPHGDRGAWAFTPDVKTLLFTQGGPDTGTDLHVMSMERGYRSKPLLQERFHEGSPTLSRDGRWIAYRSTETGRYEIYVRPFPNVDEGKSQITSDGAFVALWAPSGRELFYQNNDSMMMVVPIQTEPTFKFGKAQVLFPGRYILANRNFDISPDGQRFLMIKEATPILEPSARDEITVVLNWTEELKRLVPPK